ncbi:hypothetical protein K456DRAFT_1838097 [Colletotrichum gloeosporioides 23]|nr:hypothetical protein K456DRAFT_1838097 [Colletotrichum gloeosporioides 23]
MPCSATDAAHQDQGHSTDHEEFPPFQSHSKRDHGLAQVRKARTNTNNDPYQPSRCYPVFWANNEIRILELDSGTSDSLLHGAFSRVQVGSDRAQYEAVSYTWADESGDSTRCKPMFIGPFWDIIPITRNCENALRSVRISGGPPRNIWIDSLCINQDDEQERSSQVALMPRIYAGAAGVLVYLGTATWNSDLAMDTITRSKDSYRCVTLARSLAIFCGSKSTNWPPNHVTDHLPISVWTKFHKQRKVDPGFELLRLMTDTSSCICSDSRDRVFALLGMLHGLQEGLITADYSLTLQEISIGIASFLTQKCGRGREVLLYADINRAKSRRLPSWVPDFIEPLKPDWKIRGLLDRSLAVSRHLITSSMSAEPKLERGIPSMIRRKDKFPRRDADLTVQIHTRRASLCLPAVKLCNLAYSFKPFGSGRNFQPFVRHGSTQRAVILVPRAPSGFSDLSSWLSVVRPEDGLYWLRGIDGFAILRPNDDQISHRLICGCDVYYEAIESGDASQEGTRPSLGRNWSNFLQTLLAFDDQMCSMHLERLFDKASNAFGVADFSGAERLGAKASDLLLDIGFILKHSPRQAAKAMWESWQRFENHLLPLFQCDEGLEILRTTLESVSVMRFGTAGDGRPREIYALQDCYVRSFEDIAALIWSILPSTKPRASDWSQVVLPITSSAQILRDLQDWADLTKNLFASGGPLSISSSSRIPSIGFWDVEVQWETRVSSFRNILRGVDPLVAAQHMLSLFQEPDIAEGKCFGEALMSLSPITRAYVKAHRTQSLWDWNLFKVIMERREAFWKAMEEDTWLTSWCLDDQALIDGENRPGNWVAVQLHQGNCLELQLMIRLWLREFDFNVDAHLDIEIR